MNKFNEIADKFNMLKTDEERFRFVMEHNDILGLMLDNDQTSPVFIGKETEDLDEVTRDHLPSLNDFDDYLGWTDAVVTLCKIAGIHAEPC